MANENPPNLANVNVEVWNEWRSRHSEQFLVLGGVVLNGKKMRGVNLVNTDLRGASLTHADLTEANLGGASLIDADLTEANLERANLVGANLTRANLTGADLQSAVLTNTNLSGSKLSGANFSQALAGFTLFVNIDLRSVIGLETIRHNVPSSVGTDTISLSEGDIPEVFLRGAGLSDTFITYARSLAQHPIEYYTCFISYSSKDQAFANRLYADLQSNNVRCWFAPEDIKIGDAFRRRIDETIGLYDKLLLVLSQDSIASNWVAYEVKKALNKEPQGVPNVLFPMRLDDAVLTTQTSWVQDIKDTRHIADFSQWKNHDKYQIALSRLLRDLRASTVPELVSEADH